MSTNDLEETANYSDEELKKLLAREAQLNKDPLPSFDFVIDKYWDELCRFARSRIEQNESAEDVTLEALFNAHKAIRKFPQERIRNLHLRGWLYKITTNEVNRHLNKHGRQLSRERSLEALEPTEQALLLNYYCDNPEMLIEQKEKYEAFRKAFEQLSKKAQNALYLHVVHGLKYKEIGAKLNLEEGSIKSMISRSRTRLEKMLGEYFDKRDEKKESNP